MVYFRLWAVLFLWMAHTSLSAYALYDNRVEDKVWKSGETLLEFLEENLLPLKLYYDLDYEDEKLASDVRTSTICHILRDENYEVKQALIPLNEELQLHILRDTYGGYSMNVVPILYQTQEMRVSLKLDDIFSKDIVAKTNNFGLSVELETIFDKKVDFTKLKIGDRVTAIYSQKTRMGKFYGTQEVQAATIETDDKNNSLFLSEDGAYYDQYAKGMDVDSFMVPCQYRRISSVFTNKRWHPILKRYRAHHGIDYAGPIGTPIKAAYDGKVTFMGSKGGYGNTVIVNHARGYKTLYAHLSRYNNSVRGSTVKKGTVIGYMGSTGRSTGSHLHFGLSFNDSWINPDRKIVFQSGLIGPKKEAFLKMVKAYQGKMEELIQKGS